MNYGDVNFDGNVTAADATLVLRYAIGLIEFNTSQKTAADVNGDEEITAADANGDGAIEMSDVRALQYYVGYPGQYEPNCWCSG